jgi:hypothetical protein
MNQRQQVSTLKMEAIRSSETSVNKIYTERHIPEDGILHSEECRCENLKSYMMNLHLNRLHAFPYLFYNILFFSY